MVATMKPTDRLVTVQGVHYWIWEGVTVAGVLFQAKVLSLSVDSAEEHERLRQEICPYAPPGAQIHITRCG